MSLRSTVWIPPFGPTSTPYVSLSLSSFYGLSQTASSPDFFHSYQNVFRIVIWLFFLFVYSQAGTPFFPVLAGSLKLSTQSANLLNDWIPCTITSIYGRLSYTAWPWRLRSKVRQSLVLSKTTSI